MFTASISGKEWRSVALDEAHEMCINRDIKEAIIRPTQAYLQKTSLFLNYRIKAYKLLMKQVFPEQNQAEEKPSIIDTSSESVKVEGNIIHMINEIATNNLLPLHVTRGVLNTFTMQKATPEQQHDLLNFFEIGEKSFQFYVKYYILKIPSTDVPPRHRKLLTMDVKKTTKRILSQRDKENKLVNLCL